MCNLQSAKNCASVRTSQATVHARAQEMEKKNGSSSAPVLYFLPDAHRPVVAALVCLVLSRSCSDHGTTFRVSVIGCSVSLVNSNFHLSGSSRTHSQTRTLYGVGCFFTFPPHPLIDTWPRRGAHYGSGLCGGGAGPTR